MKNWGLAKRRRSKWHKQCFYSADLRPVHSRAAGRLWRYRGRRPDCHLRTAEAGRFFRACFYRCPGSTGHRAGRPTHPEHGRPAGTNGLCTRGEQLLRTFAEYQRFAATGRAERDRQSVCRRPDRRRGHPGDGQRGLFPLAIIDEEKGRFWAQVFSGITIRHDIAIHEGGKLPG